MLLGSTVLLGYRWPMMGLVILVSALSLTPTSAAVLLHRLRRTGGAAVQPMDTRTGGALADAVSCNQVVKAFGAETREDQRLQWVVAKWRKRSSRTWMRATNNGTAQLLALLALRTAVIGLASWLWVARPGDARRRGLCVDGILHHPGLFAGHRLAHPPSAEVGERHGRAGGYPRPAAGR